MIAGQSVLAIAAARGGSKGVPRKNVRPVGGQPMIAWTVQAARQSAHVDRLILTTDDAEIAEMARTHGCEIPFLRPPHLASDDASMMDVVHHAIAECGDGFDWVVLLQATSPLRLAGDIDALLEACVAAGAPAGVTVTPSDKSPFWMFYRDAAGGMDPVLPAAAQAKRRQELPQAYALNGAVYVARRDWIAGRSSFLSDSTLCHVMPRERSVDVDTEMDMIIAEALFSQRNNGTL
ncbi:MAG: acylneuraminate cytidylyltransferase family protein [Rhodospirillaceae bacterium]|nr:acylneuraminate cytidylyltransferase family protein [Rhodospirillales bacterium]